MHDGVEHRSGSHLDSDTCEECHDDEQTGDTRRHHVAAFVEVVVDDRFHGNLKILPAKVVIILKNKQEKAIFL